MIDWHDEVARHESMVYVVWECPANKINSRNAFKVEMLGKTFTGLNALRR